jgi:hypothetical protein
MIGRLRFLCVLCVSAVERVRPDFDAETQRTQRRRVTYFKLKLAENEWDSGMSQRLVLVASVVC